MENSLQLLQNLKTISEIIQALGIGLGAFLGAFGGLKVFLDWRASKQKEDYLKELRKKYPREGLDKDFLIADTDKSPGTWYILDKRSNTRHWVETMETMLDMGFWPGNGKRVSKETFNNYSESHSILTRRV